MDGGKPHPAKIFSLDPGALWIEALVPGEEGLSAFDPISFPAANIEYIRALGSKTASIRLKSGVDIAIDMPQSQLMDRLRNPEGSLLDLKERTLLEKRPALLERLREQFRKEAEDAKYAPLEKLAFRAWVRPPGKAEFKEFEFRGEDVRMRDISSGNSIMGGANIRLAMKDAAKAPFATADFIIEGALEEFRAMAAHACEHGDAILDLREYSLRKGTEPPAEKQAATAKGPMP